MDYTTLILGLIQAAPGLVTAIENWFIKHPRLSGETDEQYAARITQQALDMSKDTTAVNKQVIGS